MPIETENQTPDTTAAAPVESAPAASPAPEAQAPAADPVPSAVDIIAAAVGADQAADPANPATAMADAQGQTPTAAAVPAAEQTPEEKAKAEEARLDAEAKALGITKPDTTAKFKELSREAARVREMEPELVQLRERVEQQQEIFNYMEQHGVTGQQFGQAVAVLSSINSGDPVKLQTAFDMLSAQLEEIGKQLGRPVGSYDPLSAHADLVEKINRGDIDREDALEIAQLRQTRAQASAYSEQQSTQTAQQREMAAVTRELEALETHLKATDPQFSAKWAVLAPTLVPVLSNLPLSQRASAFRQAYAAFQLPAAPAVPAQTRPDPANPGRPAMGAGAKTPTNSAEAIMQGLQLG